METLPMTGSELCYHHCAINSNRIFISHFKLGFKIHVCILIASYEIVLTVQVHTDTPNIVNSLKSHLWQEANCVTITVLLIATECSFHTLNWGSYCFLCNVLATWIHTVNMEHYFLSHALQYVYMQHIVMSCILPCPRALFLMCADAYLS